MKFLKGNFRAFACLAAAVSACLVLAAAISPSSGEYNPPAGKQTYESRERTEIDAEIAEMGEKVRADDTELMLREKEKMAQERAEIDAEIAEMGQKIKAQEKYRK